jgi:hypothetical protein
MTKIVITLTCVKINAVYSSESLNSKFKLAIAIRSFCHFKVLVNSMMPSRSSSTNLARDTSVNHGFSIETLIQILSRHRRRFSEVAEFPHGRKELLLWSLSQQSRRFLEDNRGLYEYESIINLFSKNSSSNHPWESVTPLHSL